MKKFYYNYRNKSLLYSFSYLKQTYNFKYLITTKLNHDILQNSFSCIRSLGQTHDHPNALNSFSRMRFIFLILRFLECVKIVQMSYIEFDVATELCSTVDVVKKVNTILAVVKFRK